MHCCKHETEVLCEVVVDEYVITTLQKLSYEIDGYRNILHSALIDNEFKYDKDMYEWLMSDFQKVQAEYNLRILELQGMYIPNADKNINVEINFLTNTVKFSREVIK